MTFKGYDSYFNEIKFIALTNQPVWRSEPFDAIIYTTVLIVNIASFLSQQNLP